MSPSRRAWLVWSVGIAAYIVAVLQRTSLGVAGLEATDRFETSASVLASFIVVQLVVYAGLQVPAGLLLDRFGPRILIATGAALMALGQALLAVSPNVPLAIVGRVLVVHSRARPRERRVRLWTARGRVPGQRHHLWVWRSVWTVTARCSPRRRASSRPCTWVARRSR